MNFQEFYLNENQEFSSAKTSRYQVASLHTYLLKKGIYQDGQVILDWGGGKYDLSKEYIESNKDVNFYVYDLFNRDESHNQKVLNEVSMNGGADIITLANVLNVIKEKDIRISVLRDLKTYLKGKLYISVYEAPKSKEYEENDEYVGQQTKDGWQNCQPISFYINEVKSVFSVVTKKGNIIIVEK